MKLQSVAEEIRLKHGSDIETVCYPLDMNQLSDDAVYEALNVRLSKLEVGVLVNNVGIMFERLQHFLTVPKPIQSGIVDLNMKAPVLMTYMVLPQMVKRRNGAIINIGSGASVHPTPTMSTYSASKSFVDYFSKTLNYEYGGMGITIQCVQPFYVSTQITHNATPNIMMVIPETYANSAIRTLGFSARNYGYWSHALFGYLGEWLPEWLYMFGAVHINSHIWSWLTGVAVDTKKRV